MTYEIVNLKFPLYCNISVLEKPDETLDVKAYKIDVTDVTFWLYIKNFNFNINLADDISHIFFFSSKKCIAALEIVDYQNYVLIEDAIPVDDKLVLTKKLALENIQLCTEGKYDIDDIVQDEEWEILGCN